MRDEYALRPVIGAEVHTRGLDELIAALAERQRGVVARRQLVPLGLNRRAIGHRLERGRLHPLHQGVYAVGHCVLSQRGRWMAAVLACGPGAVLSHRSAAALWAIRPTGRSRIEITTPSQLRPRPGLHPHRAVLPPDEITTHDGIPTTTPARTLLDLAAVTTRQTLERALDEAEVLRLSGPQTLLDRYPRRTGTKNLRTSSSMPAIQPRPEMTSRTACSPFSTTTDSRAPRRTPSSRDSRSTRPGARPSSSSSSTGSPRTGPARPSSEIANGTADSKQPAGESSASPGSSWPSPSWPRS